VNEAPGLPLNIGLMRELVKNTKLGRKVAAEGFKGPAWTLLLRGRMPSSRVPSFAAGSIGRGGCRGWQCSCVG
jgi:hypothetical protein